MMYGLVHTKFELQFKVMSQICHQQLKFCTYEFLYILYIISAITSIIMDAAGDTALTQSS